MKTLGQHQRRTQLTVLAAIIIFGFSPFLARGVKAQEGNLVNNLAKPGARECSIAVLPGSDGQTLASAYCQDNSSAEETEIFTSFSTNTGHTWTTNSHDGGSSYDRDGELNPGNDDNGTPYVNFANPKIAYRTGANGDFSGAPELIIVYRAYSAEDGDGADGLYVDFSSDNGIDWVTPVKIESHEGAHGLFTVRPSIAVDNNSGNVYILWSTTGGSETDATGMPIDSVYVSVIGINSHSVSTPKCLETNLTGADNTANYEVDGCDIAVDQNEHAFALFRQTEYAISTEPALENLRILALTNEGTSTWTLHTAFLNLPTQVNILNYQDYPSLTISSSSCFDDDSIFIAYTQGIYTGLGTTSWAGNISNPSDLFLASALLYSTGTLSGWKSYNIQADQATANMGNSDYTFQFEPEMCPDGYGGVFLLYYSGENETSGQYPYPYQDMPPEPWLYESGVHGLQTMLTTPSGTCPTGGTYSVANYIGIAWDSYQGLAHPAWTDYEDPNDIPGAITLSVSTWGNVWTESVVGSPIGGINSNPLVGDLGFSNQRRIVMTGSEAHLVGRTTAGVMYSEQTSNNDGTGDFWTSPLELDNRDPGVVLSYPSVGVYQSSATSSENAIAVVWASDPLSLGTVHALSVPQENQVISYLYIRIKELETCEGGKISDWSLVDSVPVTISSGAATTTELVNPVVAPLTVTATPSPDRNLIGWVIYYSDNGSLWSRTYLRGNETGVEGVHPGHETENQRWGLAMAGAANLATGTNKAGSWAPCFTSTDLCPANQLVGSVGNPFLQASSFISVTSNESNGYGTSMGASDLTHEVVFSGNGQTSEGGVYHATPSFNTSGSSLGESVGAVPAQSISLSSVPMINLKAYYDRNPSVTITSTGQKLAAWERMAQYAILGSNKTYDESYIMKNYTVQTVPRSWTYLNDATGESALNTYFYIPAAPRLFGGSPQKLGWLLNPSITAFPKTTLTNSTSTTDQDPGAAEMLFWVQDTVNHTGSEQVVNDIIEEQFYESQEKTWTGGWYQLGALNPWYPTSSPYEYIGMNSQRSFGIYNKGPQYNTGGVLKNDVGADYVH